MKTIKRLAVSIQAHTEELVGRIENHEAVADSMIREMERSRARARIHFTRVQADRARLDKKLSDLKNRESQWVDRAGRVHTMDDKRALECARRVKTTREEIARTEEDRDQVWKTEEKLSADIECLERKLAEIKQRKNSLACRQECADAVSAMEKTGGTALYDASEAFSRWESRIMEKEILSDRGVEAPDSLDKEFTNEEEEEELRTLLGEITGTAANRDGDGKA